MKEWKKRRRRFAKVVAMAAHPVCRAPEAVPAAPDRHNWLIHSAFVRSDLDLCQVSVEKLRMSPCFDLLSYSAVITSSLLLSMCLFSRSWTEACSFSIRFFYFIMLSILAPSPTLLPSPPGDGVGLPSHSFPLSPSSCGPTAMHPESSPVGYSGCWTHNRWKQGLFRSMRS